MRLLISLLLLSVFWIDRATAQEERKMYDFSGLNREMVDLKKIKGHLDSVWMNYSTAIDSLVQLQDWVKSKNNLQTYVSFDLGWTLGWSRLSDLNTSLVTTSFGQMSEDVSALHLGFTFRGKRLMLGYWINDATKHINRDSNNEIKVDGICLDILVGYDILNRPRFQLYPNIGLGFNSLYIDLYKNDAAATISNFDSFLGSYTHSSLKRSTVLFQYGLELDYHLFYSPRRSGIILGLRYGATSNLGDGKWKLNDKKVSFHSEDQFRKSFFTIMLKLYMKNKGKEQ